MPCPPCPVSIRPAEDLRRLAGMERQPGHREVRFVPLAEEGSRPALAQGAPLRPADAHAAETRRRGRRTALAVLYVLLFDFLDYRDRAARPVL